jgi:ABC-type uncharacterized transport system ATPase subunit
MKLTPTRGKHLRQRAQELLGEYGVGVDPAARARDLTVEQRQFVEIARALSFGALTGVLILQLVVNVMTLAGVPPLWNQFLNGAIIIVALIISRFASGEKQE